MEEKRSRKRSQRRHDWRKARRLYEQQGKTFAEIAEIIGCDRGTVRAHAELEAWVNAAQIQRETAGERREKIYADFVERDADAIRQNLAKKHELTQRILNLSLKHVERLEQGHAIMVGTGEFAAEEDPVLALRRIALVAQTVEVVDRSLADLKDAGWRSGTGGGEADTAARSARLRADLDELERAGSRARGRRPEGPVPD